MQINKELLSKEDWEQLKKTAQEIIKNATRDLILWTNVLENVECQIKDMSKEEQKNIKSPKN